MRSLTVVVGALGSDFLASIQQVPEPAHVQAFVVQPHVEALHMRIQRALAGLSFEDG